MIGIYTECDRVIFSFKVASRIRKIKRGDSRGVYWNISFSRQVLAVGIKIIPDRAAGVKAMGCETL